MSIRIAVIGANSANVKEIRSVVVDSLSGDMEIVTATIDNYQHLKTESTDIVVCLINRREEMESFFGDEKVVAMEFIPPTEYFITLSRIPAGSSIVVFNNSTAGTHVLMSLLQRYNLTHLHYEVVAYEELSHDAVAAKIAAAQFITGGISYVGAGRTLYEKYGAYISPATTVIISPPRNATPASISRLCHAFSCLQTNITVEALKRLASIDYLTQVANRRSFDEVLAHEWARAKREKTSLSIAMLDLDFFKTYNDNYGHRAGDQCLQAIANAIKQSLLRPADFCARYGGDEFVLVLAGADSAGAMEVIERIRNAVAKLSIIHGFSAISPTITISSGYTTVLPSYKTSPEQMLKVADEALYKAKLQGRNRTIFQPLLGK